MTKIYVCVLLRLFDYVNLCVCTYIYRLTEEQRLQINKIIAGESEEPAVVTLPVSIPSDVSLMPPPPSIPSDTSTPSTRYAYEQII